MAPENTLILLELGEAETAFAPKDSAGNLAPLTTAEGLTRPEVATGFTGLGRSFDGDQAFVAVDAEDRDTLTTRDATIQLFVAIEDLDGAWPRTYYCRGLGDSEAEYYSLGFQLDRVDLPATPAHLEMKLFWMDSAGAIKMQPGEMFVVEDEAAFLLLSASRRWDSSTSVVCRYYVNDQRLGEVSSTDGDIAGDTTATTVIGCRFEAGDPVETVVGIIDSLKVSDYEVSLEEISADYQRIVTYTNIAQKIVNDRIPKGANWADKDTWWALLLQIAAGAFGFVLGKTAEFVENFLPDRSYGSDLSRWEKLHGIAPKSREPLDDRRERVVAVMGRDNGYARPQVQELLSEPMAVDEEDVEIVEFTNLVTDPMSEIRTARWFKAIDDAGNMDWESSGGVLTGTFSGAADGARWPGEPHHLVTSLSSGEGRLYVSAAMVSNNDEGVDALVGLQLYNFRTKNSLWYGMRNGEIGYQTYINGVMSAFTVAYASPPVFPLWFQIVRDFEGRSSTINEDETARDTYTLQWGTAEDAFSGGVDVLLPELEPEWFAFAILTDEDGATTGDVSVGVNDFVMFTPQGDRPFHWYVYRDPADPGTADLNLANAVTRRVKPSHTHAAAITSRELLAGDPTCLCGHGPMGGLPSEG